MKLQIGYKLLLETLKRMEKKGSNIVLTIILNTKQREHNEK